MFTGIVEEIGTISEARAASGGARFRVTSRQVLEGTDVGDSVAVDGVCLTVARIGEGWFEVDATPETLRRTALASLSVGNGVHLERALGAAGRLGGHFVQGHVDGVGKILGRRAEGDSVVARFWAPPVVGRYVAPKGSVAVDGVSLTVMCCNDELDGSSFTVALIPYTLQATLLGRKPLGSAVNLEADVLAKYVERAVIYAQRAERGEEACR